MFFPDVVDFYAAPANKTARPDAVAGGWPGAWTYAWTYADATAGPDACPTPSDGWPDSRLGPLPGRLAIPRATRSSRAFEPRL